MSHMKEVYGHTTQYIDQESGEDLGSVKVSKEILVKDEQEFCFAYSKLAVAMTNLDFCTAKVLVWCSMHASLNTNEVLLPKLVKQRLAQEMQLNERTVDNSLQKLVKQGFMHRLGTGVYHIDPETTWRGSPKIHSQNVEVYLKYTIG